MYQGVKIPASKPNANTRDIINALARILPAATKQAEQFTFLKKTGDPVKDATNVGKYVQSNFTYIKDGLTEQNIKTPGAMLATKTGDCKSFALFISAVLSSWGYRNGLRFAGYNGSAQVTHVYNFILDGQNKMFTLDACLPGLKESPNATIIEDMQVNHIAGVPVLNEIATGIYGKKERKERRKERREERQERREERRESGKTLFKGVKKVSLAPARGAFLLITKANFRGLATKLSKIPAEKLAGFWGKLGGDKDKFTAAINDGKNKNPLLGIGESVDGKPVYNVALTKDELTNDEYRAERKERRLKRRGPGSLQRRRPTLNPNFLGVDPITAGAITSAPIIVAAIKMLEDAGVTAEDIRNTIKKIAPGTEPLGNFEASDPETAQAAALTKTMPEETNTRPGMLSTDVETERPGVNFKINPLLILGVAGAAYFLMKKKGRKK